MLTGLEEDVLIDEVNKQLGIRLRKRKDDQQRKAQRAAREQQSPQEELPPAATPQPLQPVSRSPMSPDEYQERDIIRILLNGGEQYYDEDKGITIAQFILHNIDDIIEDFHNATFKGILQIYLEHLREHRTPKTTYFIHQEEASIRQLALDLLSTPYEYSENWEKKHDIYLDQKRPEHNFPKDAELAVKRLRLKKIRKKMGEVREVIDRLSAEGSDEVMTYLKLFAKLKSMHDDIARDLNSVVT